MKRGRGRGGRKPSNSPNRTMESNGPDVKVRGTAHQICEKYQALARDAHASGDRIGHESYLQHAEHYHRIILATQPAPAPEVAQTNQTSHTSDEAVAQETSAPEGSSDTPGESESNSAEAPRAGRARRGRRTRTERSERSNGRSNGSGGEVTDAAEAAEAAEAKSESSPVVEVPSNDGDAPAETA